MLSNKLTGINTTGCKADIRTQDIRRENLRCDMVSCHRSWNTGSLCRMKPQYAVTTVNHPKFVHHENVNVYSRYIL